MHETKDLKIGACRAGVIGSLTNYRNVDLVPFSRNIFVGYQRTPKNPPKCIILSSQDLPGFFLLAPGQLYPDSAI